VPPTQLGRLAPAVELPRGRPKSLQHQDKPQTRNLELRSIATATNLEKQSRDQRHAIGCAVVLAMQHAALLLQDFLVAS
jgi:hypothetical protein